MHTQTHTLTDSNHHISSTAATISWPLHRHARDTLFVPPTQKYNTTQVVSDGTTAHANNRLTYVFHRASGRDRQPTDRVSVRGRGCANVHRSVYRDIPPPAVERESDRARHHRVSANVRGRRPHHRVSDRDCHHHHHHRHRHARDTLVTDNTTRHDTNQFRLSLPRTLRNECTDIRLPPCECP